MSLLLLLKAISGALAMLLPIAKLLPQWFVHEKVAALGLLLVICFVVGLLIRTRPGRRLGEWLSQHVLDRIPGRWHQYPARFAGFAYRHCPGPVIVYQENSGGQG